MTYRPDWATHYEIDQFGEACIHINFYNLNCNDDAWDGLKTIDQIDHEVAMSDVLAQMREKPLDVRIDENTYSLADKVADMVERPPHYQLMPGVEVYDVRSALMDKMTDVAPGEVDDWSRAWEYLTRMWGKNRLEDAKKCRWYLNKLIARLEK